MGLMAEDETTFYLLIVVALVAVLGVGLAAASFATQQSMGGMVGIGGNGMMGSGGTTGTAGPGTFEWAVLLVSAAFFLLAVILLLRGRMPSPATPVPAPTRSLDRATPNTEPAPMPPSAVGVTSPPSPPSPATIAEPTLVKLLDEDERRMYLELRDHGGQMFQRDLVALGIFSKAKVTRVLDKLEAKGLVVREAHGMTNRVRLVSQPTK